MSMRIFGRQSKWLALLGCGGALLPIGACATDIGYYLLTNLNGQIPTLLDSLLGSLSSGG